MAYAHSKTIIHRDLKPQNVMIVRKGGDIFVKVLDFGIAKLLEGSIFDATTFGRRLGSMFYMSPEQCKGEPADARSDVFSLGAMMFEVLTLRRAWAWDATGRPLRAFDAPVPNDGANALSAVLMRVATAPRPRPSEQRPKLSTKFDDIVIKAMSIDPNRRFQDVASLLAEFRRALGGVSAAEVKGEFSTEMVTVKSQAPFSDLSETKLERPAENEPRGNVWKIGGIQYNDNAATTMMKEAIDDDDVDETMPKLNLTSPMDGDSGVTVGVKNVETKLFEARLPPGRSRKNGSSPDVSVTSRADPNEKSAESEAGFVTATNPRVKPMNAGAIDPNETAIASAAQDPTPLEGLIDTNATSLPGNMVLEPISAAGSPPRTELMYAVPEVAKLAKSEEVSGDQTPVWLGNFRVVAGPRAVVEKPSDPTATDQDAAADDQPLLSAIYRLVEVVIRHRLAIVGLIGMVLAFVIGIVLARWAAQEARPRSVVTVPSQPPQLKTKKFPHLDVLMSAVRAEPGSEPRMVELRDAILEATDEIADEKVKVALRRQASSAARLGDLAGLQGCIDQLRAALD
jgi:serine/threonine protein kinase